MKFLISLVVALTVVIRTQAQTVSLPWSATVKVVDEAGHPVPDANLDIWYYVKPPPGQSEASEKISGLTDANGVFKASHEDTKSISLGFKITKSGYYPTSHGHSLYMVGQFDAKTVEANHNPNLTLLLKKIGQPIPMYARKAEIQIPETDKPIGFDLLESDWVAPYGKGKQSDFIFEAHRHWVSRADFDAMLKIEFSTPSDGLIPVSIPLNQESRLRLPAMAPSEGYISELSRKLSNTHAKTWIDDTKKDQNYFFRVRSVLDEKGIVKSALYGKIHGDFVIDPINSKTMYIVFTYYLNPTPNDHNVEFDPKQNMLHGLGDSETVADP